MPTEIQTRSVGEYGFGGFYSAYSAPMEKANQLPTWSQMEIVQDGAHYIVRVNGRVVTNYIVPSGAPAPYQITLENQAADSQISPYSDDVAPGSWPWERTPNQWGDFWYRNVSLYQCTSTEDPACASALDTDSGEAPLYDGGMLATSAGSTAVSGR